MKIIQNIITLLLVACLVLIATSCRLVVYPSRDKNDQRDKVNNPIPADSAIIQAPKKQLQQQ